MKLAVLAAGALATSTLIAGAAFAAPADRWSGTYVYDAGFGQNGAGDGMAVVYRLDLSPGGCRFRADGYQTDERLLCTAIMAGDRLEVRFKSFAGGKLTNAYGVAYHKPGEALFTLEHRGGKLITTWQGYSLLDDKPRAPAVAFIRKR